MSLRKKVLHVIWSGGIGGMEEYVTTFTRYIDELIYDVHLCFISRKGIIYEEALKQNKNVVFIGMKSGFDLPGAIKFHRYLCKEKFDIIHLHTRNYLSFFMICLSPKRKLVITHHLSPGDRKVQKSAFTFYKLFGYLFDKFIAISNVVKASMVEDFHVKANRVEVIYNSIDLDKYRLISSVPDHLLQLKRAHLFTLGFVGRMTDYKRPRLFVQVAIELSKKSSGFNFIMVGDGPELVKCKKMVEMSKVEKCFSFLGFRREIPDILHLFDAMLFTSAGEGFGIVIIEAMAMGVPVFAINDGAVSEIINHKKNGFLLETDDPEMIAQQIAEVVEEKYLLEKVTKQCVSDVHSQFNIRQGAERLGNVYKELFEAEHIVKESNSGHKEL